MDIGNQIKSLRLRRGITQEAMAKHLGVTAQAVSKWERGAAAPDIEMLPAISAFFGVSIDALFALSDDTRMERIQNMLWDVRFITPADAEAAREFLLDKAKREPENGNPHALLAQMENHIAQSHHDRAAEYAKEALRRDPRLKVAHSELVEAMGGTCGDWCAYNHYALIEYYKDFVEENPDYVSGYLWLIEQLVDDNRIGEAWEYFERMAKLDNTFRTPFYRGFIALAEGNEEKAMDSFREMQENFGDDWCTWMSMGDIMALTGRYEEAKECYKKYLTIQQPPRYTDGCSATAQICEIQGDYAGAIEAVREEIRLLASDWDTTTGETVEQFQRQIARLEKKLLKQKKV